MPCWGATSTSSSRWCSCKPRVGMGARVHKVYDAARTPYQRLLEHGILSQEERQRMAEEYSRLNPVKLLLQTRQQQERLWDLATFKTQPPP